MMGNVPLDIKCHAGPAVAPRSTAFGLASIDVAVDGVKVRHRIEANEANQPNISESGDLSEALRGRGKWSYHFDADDEEYFSDGTPRKVTSLDITVENGMVVVQSDQTSRIPLHTDYLSLLERAIPEMMDTCNLALDHYYGACMEDMFDD